MKRPRIEVPSVGVIAWDVTPEMLLATAERSWPAVELALRELESERRREQILSHREAIRRLVGEPA